MLKLHHFPTPRKTALVIPILKPGKTSASPVSYRPISLLSSLPKIAERNILKRLQEISLELNVRPRQQFGCRAKHATTHQLTAVIEHVKTSSYEGRSPVLVLLDSKKAFDSSWHRGLVYKLLNYKFPIPLCKLILSYLTNRKISVKVGSSTSDELTIVAGVLQDSVLSPFLFNIYIA